MDEMNNQICFPGSRVLTRLATWRKEKVAYKILIWWVAADGTTLPAPDGTRESGTRPRVQG